MSAPLDRARSLSSTAAARELYRAWAPTYDRDVFDHAGVTGSRRIAELFTTHQPDRRSKIVDLGCGTGAVGQHLAAHGYRDVIGLDLSPEMIVRAAAGYRARVVADLRSPPVRPGSFDSSISAGTFTSGHLGAEDVAPLLDLVRSGGTVAWAVAESLWPEVRAAVVAAGAEIVVAPTERIRPDADDLAVMLVARVGNT